MKNYPLEIDALIDTGGDVCAYFSKGHHDAETFFAAIKDEFDDEIDPEQYRRLRHVTARKTGYFEWDYDGKKYRMMYKGWQLQECKAGRGAFPTTVYYP